jgi:ABC-type multidrug transport system fused ATPase/permease subunit
MAKQEMSDELKLVLVLVLLFVLYPVGLILMFKWMRWPMWVKILIALPVALIILVFLGSFLIGFLSALNPKRQIERANTATERLNTATREYTCTKQCAALNLGKGTDACIQKCLKVLEK